MKWIKYDEENRNKHLPDLMKYFRLPIVSNECFEYTVDKEPLLKLNNNCNYIIFYIPILFFYFFKIYYVGK